MSYYVLLIQQFCCEKGGEDGYTSLITCILPIIASALEDEKSEVLLVLIIVVE